MWYAEDTPNANAFDSCQQLLACLGLPSSDHKSQSDESLFFHNLRRSEKQFATVARNQIVLSCFGPRHSISVSSSNMDLVIKLFTDVYKSLGRRFVLSIPNETRYCLESADPTLCQFPDDHDQRFFEFIKLLKRTVDLISKQNGKLPKPPSSAVWNQESAKLLEEFFPLNQEFMVKSHSIAFYGQSQYSIKTEVNSSNRSLKDFCTDQVHLKRPPNRVLANSLTYEWHHAAANHTLWVEVRKFLWAKSQQALTETCCDIGNHGKYIE